MTPALARALPGIDWGWAGAGLHGDESGDLHEVVPLPHGALFAAIDGLGHGPEAARAAREAASILRMEAGLPLLDLITLCHEGLRKTRGVVMSLAVLDSRSASIEWCGVGNIESVVLRSDTMRPSETMITRGGVIGYRLPPLRVSTIAVWPRDVLVMVSDGIRSGFTEAIGVECEPQAIAEAVLARYAKGSDDALVFVARCPGGSP